jgi:SAM-dependent methyltransferase
VATERKYEGTELELFQDAHNWKAYWAAKIAPFVKGAVLEVGAGLGANLASIGSGPGRRWTLLEPDPRLCAEISARIARGELPAGTRAVCGILRDLPADLRFDSIVYIDVLEHIEDDRGQLVEAAARLNAGGSLIVLSPAYQFVFSPFDAAIGHFRRYDRHSLLALTPASLQPVRTFYLDSLGLLLSLANRLLLRSPMPSATAIRTWDSAVVPLSRLIDPILRFSTGRSIVAIWSKKATR